jgi:hypothetical protein
VREVILSTHSNPHKHPAKMKNQKPIQTPLSSHFSILIQGENPLMEGDFSEFLKLYDKKGIVTYCKYAKEEGGDTANIHYHLFLRVSTQQRNSYFFNPMYKDGLPFHIDDKVFNVKSALQYVGDVNFVYSENHTTEEKRGKTKGGKCCWIREYGDIKTVRIPKPGKLGNDLDARLESLKALIAEGCSITELYNHDFPTMIKYGRQLKDYITAINIESEAMTHIAMVGSRLAEQEARHRVEIEQINTEFDRRMLEQIKREF